MDSSLSTLTVTSLNHVTKVLSPAFNADTIFYEVNATSSTDTADACARSEAATGLNVNRQAVPAIYIMHSTAPAYQENRVLVSVCDTTTTTYVVHAFFRPVPCDCYAGTCNSFDGSCVCDAEYGSSCKTYCPGVCPATTGRCATRHPTGAVCATRHSVAQVATCKVVPIVLCLKGSADLDSEWTCRCTGS